MSGLRSVTIGTSDLKTQNLFNNILGLNVATKGQALRFGDAELNPGTRLHFVEVLILIIEMYIYQAWD